MTYRAVFFAADPARSAARSLVRDGFSAQVVRSGPSAEPDWVVLTDAPEIVLELLVERYDGWLETS
jgi:hypothetical protein